MRITFIVIVISSYPYYQCSYNSVNGAPMCGNEQLLNKQIRGAWNRSDALIVTDCGAVVNMVAALTPASRRLKSLVDATALSINSGVDLETGPVWLVIQANHNGRTCMFYHMA